MVNTKARYNETHVFAWKGKLRNLSLSQFAPWQNTSSADLFKFGEFVVGVRVAGEIVVGVKADGEFVSAIGVSVGVSVAELITSMHK